MPIPVRNRIEETYNRLLRSRKATILFEPFMPGPPLMIDVWPRSPRFRFRIEPVKALENMEKYLFDAFANHYHGKRTAIEETLAIVVLVSTVYILSGGLGWAVLSLTNFILWFLFGLIIVATFYYLSKKPVKEVESSIRELDYISRSKFVLIARFLEDLISKSMYRCHGEKTMYTSPFGKIYTYRCYEKKGKIIIKLRRYS